MSQRWFRLYCGVLHDPKVQLLGVLFQPWVNLLCLAGDNDGTLPCMTEVAFALRVAESEAASIVAKLMAAGLIDETEFGLSPHNWKVRQYVSDNSTERVRRHRKKIMRNAVSETFCATSSVTQSTVTETPPDTDTDTDTEQRQSSAPPPIPPANGFDCTGSFCAGKHIVGFEMT